MKEDILEQVVDDYLQHRGYFTRHNIRFKPDPLHPEYIQRDDSATSDVDVIGIHPLYRGADAVWVVSCKSWQQGFDATAKVREIEQNKKAAGRDAWRGFRELTKHKWAEAFRRTVKEVTGREEFTYVTAVTSLRGRREDWEQCKLFREHLSGNPNCIITLAEMVDELWPQITTTPATSEIGRLLQLLKASHWRTPESRTRRPSRRAGR